MRYYHIWVWIHSWKVISLNMYVCVYTEVTHACWVSHVPLVKLKGILRRSCVPVFACEGFGDRGSALPGTPWNQWYTHTFMFQDIFSKYHKITRIVFAEPITIILLNLSDARRAFSLCHFSTSCQRSGALSRAIFLSLATTFFVICWPWCF